MHLYQYLSKIKIETQVTPVNLDGIIMSRHALYNRVSKKLGVSVQINEKLCLYNPEEVYRALVSNQTIIKWLKFISNHYIPPGKEILLIYPCSAVKPYHKSRSYKILFNTLEKLGNQKTNIHLVTISEPFGIIPEEFYDQFSSWYDCPGLFPWWCNRYGQPYNEKKAMECIDILAHYIACFLRKAMKMGTYKHIIGFVRTYSSSLRVHSGLTHRLMLEKASKIAGVSVELHPSADLVRRIVKTRGKAAWDLYGVAHPLAQEYLLKLLERRLHDSKR